MQKQLETQIKTLAGATHEASMKDVGLRITTAENRIEKHRKRLKLVEELEGATPIVKEVRQL
jgi:hypothetical protein